MRYRTRALSLSIALANKVCRSPTEQILGMGQSQLRPSGLARLSMSDLDRQCKGLTSKGLTAALALVASVLGFDRVMAQALSPTAAFVQAGAASQTRDITAGLIWDWNRQWTVGAGVVTGYWEASISRMACHLSIQFEYAREILYFL